MDLRSQRTSLEQFATMIGYMEQNGDLSRPQPGPQGRLSSKKHWRELTNILNSVGTGGKKLQEKWKKVWADLKTKTKKKAWIIKFDPHNRLVLNPLEKRLMTIRSMANVDSLEFRGKKLKFSTLGPQKPATAPVPIKENKKIEEITSYIEDGMKEDPSSPESPSLQSSTPIPTLAASCRESSPQPASRGDRAASPRPGPRRRRPPRCQHSNPFLALEHRRLKLEELKVRNQHERERERERNLHERETERLKLDAKRLELEARKLELHAEESAVMRRFNAWLERPK